MAEGPEHGLRVLDALDRRGTLPGYHLLPATRAALLARVGRIAEAVAAYEEALRLVQQLPGDEVATRIDRALLDVDKIDLDVRRWWLGRDI